MWAFKVLINVKLLAKLLWAAFSIGLDRYQWENDHKNIIVKVRKRLIEIKFWTITKLIESIVNR